MKAIIPVVRELESFLIKVVCEYVNRIMWVWGIMGNSKKFKYVFFLKLL